MQHDKRLHNRIAVVTGGAGGIGQAVAALFAEHGARVIVTDVNDQAGHAVAEALHGAGYETHYVHADVTESSDVQALHDYVMERYKKLDIVIHTAGISGRPLGDGPVTQCEEDVWQRVIEINLTGAYIVSRYLVPPMVHQRSGRVVHIASDDAISIPRPPHDTHAYIAAKGGLMALTKAMAISYAPYNVRVNAIAPGWIETPMTSDLKHDAVGYRALIDRHPLGRLGQPKDIAQAALFLASDESSFITGHVLPVEGGATV